MHISTFGLVRTKSLWFGRCFVRHLVPQKRLETEEKIEEQKQELFIGR